MRARNLNATEREQLRRQRSELRLIVARCKERRFEYVVNPPVVPKVAFGTTMHREVMPTSGPFMDSNMRRNQPELLMGPGPFSYDVCPPIGFKYPSAAGFAPLASKVPRLPLFRDLGIPPLGSYAPENWRPTNRAGFTFNKEMVNRQPKWLTPGPPTYPYHIGYPKGNIEMGFGACRINWPAVAVYCGPYNTSLCMQCHQTPIGDYFHNFSSSQDLCRKCMHALLRVIKSCDLQVVERLRKRREIKLFVPARYCGFFHDHNGTLAAKELTTRKELRDKIRVENYLYRFHEKTAT